MRPNINELWLVPALVAGLALFAFLLPGVGPGAIKGTVHEVPLPSADLYDATVESSGVHRRGATGDEQADAGDPILIAILPGASEQRLEAIAMLSVSTDPVAVLTLRSLLDDPEPLVRQEAVESLGAVGGSEAIAGLDYALSDSDVTVRRLAIEALFQIGTDEAYGALTWTLIEDDVRLRRLVVQKLVELDNVAARVLLEQFQAHGVRASMID